MKIKGVLLCSLLSLATLISCGGGQTSEDNSGSEGTSIESNISLFPGDEIKEYFSTDEVPPSFKGSEFFVEKSTDENNKYIAVYTAKNNEGSVSYFDSYLLNLNYEIKNNDGYRSATSASSGYSLIYFEQEVEGTIYFVVQYYYQALNGGNGEGNGGESNDKTYDEDFVYSATFPSASIKGFFNTNEELPAFSADGYYYARTYDDYGDDLFYIYSDKSSTACNSAYYTILSNAGYIVEEYEDETGAYYYAYSENSGYEIIFFEDAEYNSFDLQVYYFDGSESGGGSSETEDTIYYSFPANEIKTIIGANALLPGYEADTYYYGEFEFDGIYIAYVYSEISSTACNNAYKTILENANYTVEYVEDTEYGSYYEAFNASAGYDVVFYEEDGYFCVDIYAYEGTGEDIGGGSGDQTYDEDFIYSASFPSEIIKDFFNTNSTLVSYSASGYYYARTYDDYGDDLFYIYSDKSSTACNSAYYTILSNAGYTVEEYEDEDGVYYYAYNDSTGYELIFFEDADYNSFDVQIYYYGETNSGGNNGGSTGGDNVDLSDAIVITSTHWDNTGYVETTFTVDGVTFKSDRVMLSTNTDYKDAMQFSNKDKGSGTIYNTSGIEGATTIEIDLNYSSDYNMVVYVGNSTSSCTTVATMTKNGDIYSYDITGYSYFKIVNESARACYIDSITIK